MPAGAGIAAFRTPEACADALSAYLDWRPASATNAIERLPDEQWHSDYPSTLLGSKGLQAGHANCQLLDALAEGHKAVGQTTQEQSIDLQQWIGSGADGIPRLVKICECLLIRGTAPECRQA